MPVPEVLSIRELRTHLSAVVDEVAVRGAVFAGSHRRPQVVVMSVAQYEALTHRAGESAKVED